MIRPQVANAVVFAFVVVLLAGFGVTAIMKARVAQENAVREDGRRGRAEPADPSLPDWFRRMDRNKDATVSRQEFVGTDAQFQAIDTDGDGAISPAEARAADGWFRNEVPD